jgi:hypothetical protein
MAFLPMATASSCRVRKPSSRPADVDAVAEYIAVLNDDIAKIDTGAEA